MLLLSNLPGQSKVTCGVCFRLQSCGGQRVELDFKPLCDLALMLYGSALVSERYAGISEFLAGTDSSKGSKRCANGLVDIEEDSRLLPVTRRIVNGAGEQPWQCALHLRVFVGRLCDLTNGLAALRRRLLLCGCVQCSGAAAEEGCTVPESPE